MRTPTLRLGRVWLCFDTSHLRRRGRDGSVIYSVLGLVLKRHQPEGYEKKVAGTNRARLIRRWQRELIKLWGFTEWQVPLREGESLPEWNRRRWRHCVVQYEARAAFERAIDPDVPTVDQLTSWAPASFQIPATAYSG